MWVVFFLLCGLCITSGKGTTSHLTIDPLKPWDFNTTWRIQVHYSPDHFYDGLDLVSPRDFIATGAATPPLRCDIVIHVSAASPNYIAHNEALTQISRHKIEFLRRLDSKDCYIEGTPLEPHLPSYHPRTDKTPDYLRENYRSRYDFMLHLMKLMRDGYISFYTPQDSSSNRNFPWMASQDGDLLFTSLRYSYPKLFRVLEKSLSLNQTLEERACLTPNNTWFDCDPLTQPFLGPEKVSLHTNDFAFVASHEAGSYDYWLLNTGHLLFQPSRLTGFILHSTLSVFNYTGIQGKFDYSDQGRMNFIVREVFDFDWNRLRALTIPWPSSLHRLSFAAGELSYIRKLNVHRTARHPLLKDIYAFWFTQGENPPFPAFATEPKYLALTTPRLLNAPGCRNFYFSNEDTGFWKEDVLWRCGDGWVHFNGCKKEAYLDSWWRRQFLDVPACQQIIPFSTNDDGSTPFDLFHWTFVDTQTKKNSEIYKTRNVPRERFVDPFKPIPIS